MNNNPLDYNQFLNRPVFEAPPERLTGFIAGRNILITGAGGTIGAEIARQVAGLKPARLVLLDSSEFNLFEIERELRAQNQLTDRLEAILDDMQHSGWLTDWLNLFEIDVVLHVAAYKHVHLLEKNQRAAARNNIRPFLNLLSSLEEIERTRGKAPRLVNISSDKAVNPVSVMGYTKRINERLTTAWAGNNRTCFSIRFGNILASSGSVIPIFEEQIARGGPVTVTDKDAIRYFMGLSEAACFVLAAGSIAHPGAIYYLDMGAPINIHDLAHQLIRSHGLVPDQDVEIHIIGLRPGEKLNEELLVEGREMPTELERVFRVPVEPEDEEYIRRVREFIQQSLELTEGAARDYPWGEKLKNLALG